MKNSKKNLSVLLLIVTIFVGCTKKNEENNVEMKSGWVIEVKLTPEQVFKNSQIGFIHNDYLDYVEKKTNFQSFVKSSNDIHTQESKNYVSNIYKSTSVYTNNITGRCLNNFEKAITSDTKSIKDFLPEKEAPIIFKTDVLSNGFLTKYMTEISELLFSDSTAMQFSRGDISKYLQDILILGDRINKSIIISTEAKQCLIEALEIMYYSSSYWCKKISEKESKWEQVIAISYNDFIKQQLSDPTKAPVKPFWKHFFKVLKIVACDVAGGLVGFAVGGPVTGTIIGAAAGSALGAGLTYGLDM